MGDDLAFGILGPVEARLGDRPVPLGRPRARALLGYLLTCPNRVLSTDQLVDALWDGSTPATARSQVQADISALRRALADCGQDEVIVTAPPGYLLRAPESRIDLTAFRRETASARAALAGGDPAEAAGAYRRALACWRGRPLDGVVAGYADAVRAGLAEQRLTTYEQLVDVELALGRHLDLVAELCATIEAHPLRESLARRGMIALYRCGRQSDALLVARRLRQLLREEEGLDPGRSIRALEQAILTADPRLDHRPTDRPGPEPFRPAASAARRVRTPRSWYASAARLPHPTRRLTDSRRSGSSGGRSGRRAAG
ncbi:AfsR/SARP family transcriptional regulator [Micromonospora auratinigra]|nr:AfsR/SARP family transcriptional regulator [Micromonospora auratinigra]